MPMTLINVYDAGTLQIMNLISDRSHFTIPIPICELQNIALSEFNY